ncbi:MAG: hypothetical protein LBR07_05015 [Puniceicoccales bacterium]|jgi:processive 1,2-diacylglycerol beta-glucosyltransferase|nr:hypothetical protein [Puniceicoccales bacterium]
MKLLLLTSSTGGGHDMRARSFERWAASPAAAHLGIVTARHQALEDGGSRLYAFGAWLYNFIQRVRPALHHIYFNVLEIVPFCGRAGAMPGRAAFEELVRREVPDIVLSTHDHLNHAFLEAARLALPARPPLVGTYCGELAGGYGFSKHWVNPRADFFIGAVDACVAEARRLGMPAEKSWTGGFMLDPDFYQWPVASGQWSVDGGQWSVDGGQWPVDGGQKAEARRFTLLLGTGANGANNHIALLDAFARFHAADATASTGSAAGAIHSPRLIALCGRNDAARRAVEAWAAAHPQFAVEALAYRDDMRAVMSRCDAIFARPGTGTTSEAIQCGLPVLFNGIGGVMPQEIITLRHCRRHFETHVVRRPRDLPPLVAAWAGDPARLAQVRAGVASARPAGTPLQILERLAALAAAR